MTTQVIAEINAVLDAFDEDADALLTGLVVPLTKAHQDLIAGAVGTPTVVGQSFATDVVVRSVDGNTYLASPRTTKVASEGDEIIADLNTPEGEALHSAIQNLAGAIWYAQNDSYKALSFASGACHTLRELQ